MSHLFSRNEDLELDYNSVTFNSPLYLNPQKTFIEGEVSATATKYTPNSGSGVGGLPMFSFEMSVGTVVSAKSFITAIRISDNSQYALENNTLLWLSPGFIFSTTLVSNSFSWSGGGSAPSSLSWTATPTAIPTIWKIEARSLLVNFVVAHKLTIVSPSTFPINSLIATG